MSNGRHNRNTLTWATKLMFCFLLYFGFAKLGILLATINDNASPVWPASGWAIAALLLFGRSMWPAIAAAAFLVNTEAGSPLAANLAIASGNTLEALIAATLIHHISKSRTIFAFHSQLVGIIVGSFVGALISAMFGALSLILSGAIQFSLFRSTVATWWVGDVLGAMVVVPAALSFAALPFHDKSLSIRKFFETVALTFLTGCIAYVIFLSPEGTSFLFLLFPLVLVGVVHGGRAEAHFLTILLCGAAIGATFLGHGPFHGGALNENLIHLQLFLGSLALTTMMLGGLRDAGPLHLSSVVLLTGWLVTGWVFHSFHREEEARDDVRFKTLIAEAEGKIRTRMAAYEDGLRGGVSLLETIPTTSRAQWASYVSALGLGERYSGINGVGYVKPVETAQLAEFVKSQKLDNAPEFALKTLQPNPSSDPARKEHYIIAFIEPLSPNAAALGLDLASEVNRRAAAERARDSGSPSITAKIELVQDNQRRPGFLLYLPMYQGGFVPRTIEERRKQFLGWVYAPFVTQNFFDGILGKGSKEIDLQVFDNDRLTDDSFLYTSSSAASNAEAPHTTKVELGQHTFTVSWKKSPGFVSSHDTSSAWAGACGALITLLLASLFTSLHSIAQRARELAAKQTILLRGREQMLSALLENLPVALCCRDQSRRLAVTLWNKKCEDLFGFSKTEAIGKTFGELFAEQQAHELATGDADLVSNSQLVELPNITVFSKARGEVNLHIFKVPVPDASGKEPLLLTIMDDITTQKKTEQDLIAAREAALSAAAAKSQFLANMSHEIRTPLTAIIGFSEILQTTDLRSGEAQEVVGSVLNNSRHLLGIINDILDLAKIDAGAMKVERLDCSPAGIVAEVLKTMAVRAQEKNLCLKPNLHMPLPEVINSDPTKIKQILINLIGNAIKFTESGTVTVDLSWNEKSRSLAFSVIDTGIGLSETQRLSLFQPFSQADASTTRKYGGTGLGLAICHRLAGLLGGRLEVESEPGRGSTFTFKLSLNYCPTSTLESMPKGKEGVSEGAPADDYAISGSLLVADDAQDNRRLLEFIFRKTQVNLTFVQNGLEAIEAVSKRHFDLILMDMQMPEMDGYQATEEIRRRGIGAPIVAVTANALQQHVAESLKAGCNAHLAKPFTGKELLATVKKYLSPSH